MAKCISCTWMYQLYWTWITLDSQLFSTGWLFPPLSQQPVQKEVSRLENSPLHGNESIFCGHPSTNPLVKALIVLEVQRLPQDRQEGYQLPCSLVKCVQPWGVGFPGMGSFYPERQLCSCMQFPWRKIHLFSVTPHRPCILSYLVLDKLNSNRAKNHQKLVFCWCNALCRSLDLL